MNRLDKETVLKNLFQRSALAVHPPKDFDKVVGRFIELAAP